MKQVLLMGNDGFYQDKLRQYSAQQPYFVFLDAPQMNIKEQSSVDAFSHWWDEKFGKADVLPYVLYVYGVSQRSHVGNLTRWLLHLYSRRATVFFINIGGPDEVQEMRADMEKRLPRPATTGRLFVIDGFAFYLDEGVRCFELLLSAVLAPTPVVKELTQAAFAAGGGVGLLCGFLLWCRRSGPGRST